MKKAKTPLLAFLQKAFAISLESKKPGAPSAEKIIEEARNRYWSRRNFMQTSGKAALAAGLGTTLTSCFKDDALMGFGDEIKKPQEDSEADEKTDLNIHNARVAIVGGGMAGLHAMHILKSNDVEHVTLFEASERPGGRIMTVNGVMGNDFYTEFGGEFIDSDHTDVLDLVSYFNLNLLDMQSPSELALIKDAYYFNGQHYSLMDVVNAFSAISQQIAADVDSLSEYVTYDSYTPNDEYFDNLSIPAYLDSIGATGLIKELLEVAYKTEYGLEPELQSCINMLFLIGTTNEPFEIFGESDERYKVEGGNQQIVDNLANLYANHIEYNKALTGIDKQNGEYKLYLTGYNNPQTFDVVLMTIPFTKLRQVDIMFDLPTWKTNAIQNLGYGTNSKLMLGFNKRKWRDQGYSGYVFSDNGVQSGWDNTQLQPGNKGGYTVYLGGNEGLNLGNGSLNSKVNFYLPKLDEIFPGSENKYNGNKARMPWPQHPWTLCSYACYLVGQYTTIAGAEFKKVGKLYFAGEHCSLDYQGYMNGAAFTGRKAAQKILNLLA